MVFALAAVEGPPSGRCGRWREGYFPRVSVWHQLSHREVHAAVWVAAAGNPAEGSFSSSSRAYFPVFDGDRLRSWNGRVE